MVGKTALTTATGTVFDVPPPGLGVITVIGRLDKGLMRSDAGILTVSCVLLTYVVGRDEPFHCTTEFTIKPVPVTVKAIEDVPAPRVLGETEVTAGTPGGLMVKFAEAWPPPGVGLVTATAM